MKKILMICAATVLLSANAMGQWSYPYVAKSPFVPTDKSLMGLHGMVKTVEWQQIDTLDDGEVVKDTLLHRYDEVGRVVEIVSLWQEEYPWSYYKYKDGRISEVICKSTIDSILYVYHYSSDGCLKEIIYDYLDGTGNDTIAFSCDAQCRIISEHGKLATGVNYFYNAEGLLVKHVFENSDILRYGYNEKGQIIKTVSESGKLVRTRTFVRNIYGDVVDEYVTETGKGTTHNHFEYTYDSHGNWLTCHRGNCVTTRRITYY